MFSTRNLERLLVLAAIAILCSMPMAFAQATGVGPAPAEPGLAVLILRTFQPIIVEIASVIVTICIALVSAKFSQKLGVDIQAKWQSDIHTAAMTGVQVGLSRLGAPADQPLGDAAREAVIGYAVQHMRQSVPDAIKGLKVADDVLVRVPTAKLEAVRNSVPVVPTSSAP